MNCQRCGKPMQNNIQQMYQGAAQAYCACMSQMGTGLQQGPREDWAHYTTQQTHDRLARVESLLLEVLQILKRPEEKG